MKIELDLLQTDFAWSHNIYCSDTHYKSVLGTKSHAWHVQNIVQSLLSREHKFTGVLLVAMMLWLVVQYFTLFMVLPYH